MINVTVPGLVVKSELNRPRAEHWGTKNRRVQKQKEAVWNWIFDQTVPPLPVTVLLTRIYGGKGKPMDVGDNLNGSLKHVRDTVAKFLGVDDKDPRVTWTYAQEKGTPGVRIEIT